MAFYGCGSGSGTTYEDGNDIIYPVTLPSQQDKLYREIYVDEIAQAIGKELTIAEMADEVKKLKGGLKPTSIILHSATYTSSDL